MKQTLNHYILLTFFFLAYQKAVREQRMRTEISQAKREANFYLENVDKNKAIKAIVERKRKRNPETVDVQVKKI